MHLSDCVYLQTNYQFIALLMIVKVRFLKTMLGIQEQQPDRATMTEKLISLLIIPMNNKYILKNLLPVYDGLLG